jgi:uncharacterized protein (TIGR03790 family)
MLPASTISTAIAVIGREELKQLRTELLERLPSSVHSMLLVWSKPYAAECMSITTALAAGYQPGFCEPGCGRTTLNQLFDTQGWLPADTTGWLPAMLLPSDDEAMARAVIDRGIASDGARPAGTAYLVRTQDTSRNVRAAGYADAQAVLANRVRVLELTVPIGRPPTDIIAYFTGVAGVEELHSLGFRPGAAADHLTSAGGRRQPSRKISQPRDISRPLFTRRHALEAYWKSMAMPGQGLFIGEPLARPYATHR